MIILLTGNTSSEVYAEKIRNRLSYIGHPVICYDYNEPCGAVHDGAMLALQRYKDVVDLPIKDVFEDPRDEMFMFKIREWLSANNISVRTIAKARIKELTSRWEELGMIYTVIVHGNMNQKDVESFPDSYKVFLDCSNKEYRPDSVHFNDCAVSNIFDHVVDTNKMTPEEAATLVSTSYTNKIKSSFSK